MGSMNGAILVIAAAITWVVWRRHRRARSHRTFTATTAPRSYWTARAAEAIALATMTVPVLWVITAEGPMVHLGEIRPEFASIQVKAFAVVCALVLLAIAAALRGWTVAAAVLLAVTLVGYESVQATRPNVLAALAPDGADRPIVHYTISLTNDIQGADLWVNDVYLGKTPVLMTLDEFHEKVKPWPELPKNPSAESPARAGAGVAPTDVQLPPYDTGTSFSTLKIVRDDASYSFSRYKSEYTGDDYYAQVRFAGEWARGHGGGTGGSGGSYRWDFETTLNVVFPLREERLSKLLSKVRATDYRGDEGLFSVLKTYGTQGWKAVRKAAQTEPRMMEFFDAWASSRYGLNNVTDAKTAWAALDRIRSEAVSAGEYNSLGLEGRAVELLVPLLDQRQLVDEAIALVPLARRNYYGYGRGTEFGQPYFFASRTHFPGSPELPMAIYPIAHAVWKTNVALVAKGAATENLIQTNLVPEIMRAFRGQLELGPYDFFVQLGGPEMDRYLLRQPWQRPPDRSRYRDDAMSVRGHDVNKWLYHLASLPDNAGHSFRSQHGDEVKDLADEVLWRSGSTTRGDLPDFLFLDLDLGSRSLAAEYWPQYKDKASLGDSFGLKWMWEYLVKMEPVSTVQMYVDAWKSFSGDYTDRDDAMRMLDGIEPTKRETVIDAIRKEITGTTQINDKFWSDNPQGWRDYLLRELQTHEPETQQAREAVAELSAGVERGHTPRALQYLQRNPPNRPLIAALAESANPDWRLMVMDAIEADPTPENRAVLEKLGEDPDEAVRQAAYTVKDRLQVFADTPDESLHADAF